MGSIDDDRGDDDGEEAELDEEESSCDAADSYKPSRFGVVEDRVRPYRANSEILCSRV